MVIELAVGKPARCVKADSNGFFNVGDVTWCNNLVDVPVEADGKTALYAMMQHPKGFVYVPATFFEGLTDEEIAEFESQVEEFTKELEATN